MLYERACNVYQHILGTSHPDILRTKLYLSELKGTDDVLAIREALYESCRRMWGDDHPDTLTAINNLAREYSIRGKVKELLILGEKIETMLSRNPNQLTYIAFISMSILIPSYDDLGLFKKAYHLVKKVYEISCTQLGKQHELTQQLFKFMKSYEQNISVDK